MEGNSLPGRTCLSSLRRIDRHASPVLRCSFLRDSSELDGAKKRLRLLRSCLLLAAALLR